MEGDDRIEERKLFRSIDVWRRLNTGNLVKYCCLQRLGSGNYYVLAMHHYYVPVDAGQLPKRDFYFYDLLSNQDFLEVQDQGYASLEQAIEFCDRPFAEG